MRAVWTLWTKPFRAHRSGAWLSEKHHLLSWILSLETARRHHPETALMTDDQGARLLVDGLGLEFGEVSTELNVLDDQDPGWWPLGKLYAYRAQTAPFIHVDSDVFLWKPLPERLTSAPVCAQNPEHFTFGDDASWYRPEFFNEMVESRQGWVPVEWQWYIKRQTGAAVCCGILGGRAVGFLVHYANAAIQMIEHPRNQPIHALMHNKVTDSMLFEQYFLAACLAYHRHHATSAFDGVTIQYLFDSVADAFDPAKARDAGFTHLIAGAKRDPHLMERLETRVRRDHPVLYERCVRYLSDGR